MKLTNKQKGELGEILVSMELMNMGLDVVNINTVYRNYKNADLICMNANNGKRSATYHPRLHRVVRLVLSATAI